MTINVAPERSMLSLPGARLRAEGGAASARTGAPAGEAQPGRASPVTLSRGGPAGIAELRTVVAGLDRASSAADVAMAATHTIAGLLGQLRDEAAAARSPGAQRVQAFTALVDGIGEQAQAAGFGGVNLLDGSVPGGVLRLPVDSDGSGEISLTARDMRPGGPLVTVSADQDPVTALADVEASLANVEAAGEGLREESKRLDAHRAFIGVLSEAISGQPEAGLDVEGARLAALQIRQALSGQSMSVSNAAPQAVLSLFR